MMMAGGVRRTALGARTRRSYLPPRDGEDAGKVQSIGARFAHGELTLAEASELGCRACGTPAEVPVPRHGGHVAGRRRGTGASAPALRARPSGQPIWHDMARRSARALVARAGRGRTIADILTEPSIRNAMVVHAAFGGSTNLILHIPAVAFAAGLPGPRSTTGTRST